ncbi:MAG: efflux RND transporter periplasmic adaptor subunit [Pseudomonadota bacterium]
MKKISRLKKINRSWFTKRKIVLIVASLLLILWFFHWEEKGAMLAKPIVTVTQVKKQTVPVYLNYVGNTAAKEIVDIRARVEGFLIERAFVEGDDVKKGDLMFVIDPKPFETALAEAKAQLVKDEATLAFAKEQVERYRSLVEKEYVTREDFDNYVTKADEAAAAVEADKAAVVQAELNLGYCNMYAPFDGRIGRTLVNVGNLVGAGQDTKLATIVMLDPIYTYFSPSDEDVYRILKEKQKGALPVDLTFSDGTKYPHQGKVNFVDNKVDTATSTLTMRATIPNPEKTLLPGIYANVRLYLKDMSDALLVPEKALGEDQGGQYVMVIVDNDVARRSYVKTGEPIDGMRVITDGVSDGDMVVIDGLQLIRPGMEVVAKIADTKDKDTLQGIVNKAVLDR